MDMQSSLFFKEYEEPKCPNCSIFLFFFKWWQIVDWDMLGSSANSHVLLHWLHSTSYLKASWWVSGFICQWLIVRMKLWKPILNLAINTWNFLSWFCNILLFLNFYNITYWLFPFKAVCISPYANALWKDINPSFLFPAMSKYWVES